MWLWGPCGSQKQNLTHSGSASVACEESLSGKNEDINLSTRTGIFPIFKSITTKMMLDNLHTHVIVPDNKSPVEKRKSKKITLRPLPRNKVHGDRRG